MKASLGARLGIAAVEGRGVDGEDGGPALWPAGNEQLPESFHVDPTTGERLVEAALASPEHRLKVTIQVPEA